jgi:hypothetical protein
MYSRRDFLAISSASLLLGRSVFSKHYMPVLVWRVGNKGTYGWPEIMAFSE